MNFVYLPVFIKKLKELAKKYPSVRDDFEKLLSQLQQYPKVGTPLGRDCYKIRLAIKSKGQGKSGGARIITCLKIHNDTIYFLTVYDKSEQETITDKDLTILIEFILRNY